MHICFYISGHGFGHAARVQAVVEQLLQEEGWTIELRTSAPRWFFEWLLDHRCALSAVELDPGVAQSDSFSHDALATAEAWERLIATADALVEAEAEHLLSSGCRLVLADVAPLACAAASQARLPCLVLGNFTWDWILHDYLASEPRFGPIIDWIRARYRLAGTYLRLPMSPDTDLFAEQEPVGFTARRARLAPDRVRARLGLRPEETMVLLSFGGFGVDQLELEPVRRCPGLRCVWDRGPGRAPELISARGMDLHYPDLIRAADIILTKPGFSIISEAIAHGTLLAYAPRTGFRESALLEAHLRERWPSVAVSQEALADGSWVGPAVELVRRHAGRPLPRLPADGAQQIADRIRREAS